MSCASYNLQSEILSKFLFYLLGGNNTTLLSNAILYDLFTKKRKVILLPLLRRQDKRENYFRCTGNRFLYILILERENWLHVQKALRLKNYSHLNAMAVFLLLCPAPFPSSHTCLGFVIKWMGLLRMACILDCYWDISYELTDVMYTDIECRVGQGLRTVPGYRYSAHVLCYLLTFQGMPYFKAPWQCGARRSKIWTLGSSHWIPMSQGL